MRYYGGAVLYAVAGYLLGLAGLFAESWAVNLVATLLLAHAMTIAAYLIHECGHNLIFKRIEHNTRTTRPCLSTCRHRTKGIPIGSRNIHSNRQCILAVSTGSERNDRRQCGVIPDIVLAWI